MVVGHYGWGGIVVVPMDGGEAQTHALGAQVGFLSLDPAGRRLAVSTGLSQSSEDPDQNAIRVLDLATGAIQALGNISKGGDCGTGFLFSDTPHFLRDGRLVSDGQAGLLLWDLADGSSRRLRPCQVSDGGGGLSVAATPDGQSIVTLFWPLDPGGRSILSVFDLAEETTRFITTHGTRALALDPAGTILVTGDNDGLVRVGPLGGEEPHLLYGHTDKVTSVAVSPDGQWVASASDDGTIRLWPMPDVTRAPLHALPYEELMVKLRALTNVRVVEDPGSATGYKLDADPFPGWAAVPSW